MGWGKPKHTVEIDNCMACTNPAQWAIVFGGSELRVCSDHTDDKHLAEIRGKDDCIRQ